MTAYIEACAQIARNDPLTAESWQAWELTDDDSQIVAVFSKRYGAAPTTIKAAGPIKLAGPIPGSPDWQRRV